MSGAIEPGVGAGERVLSGALPVGVGRAGEVDYVAVAGAGVNSVGGRLAENRLNGRRIWGRNSLIGVI
jgi:hypothetical protein